MFMTKSMPKCPGGECVVNNHPDTDQEIPKSLPSTECGTEAKQLIPVPPSSFEWPDYALDIARAFVDSGFEHLHKHFYPQMYFTGFAADQGRESVEAYFRPGPAHFENPQPYTPTYPLNPCPNTFPALQMSCSPSNPAVDPTYEHPSYPNEESAGSLMALLHMGPFSQGPKDCVHGGAIATSVDVLMYRTIVGCGVIGVTANLNVNYRRVIPINQVVVVRVNVPASNTRKVVANFGIFSLDHTILYAEGSGLFIRPKEWDQNPELILSKK